MEIYIYSEMITMVKLINSLSLHIVTNFEGGVRTLKTCPLSKFKYTTQC